MGQLLEECVCYFKKRDVYKKLFSALRKKYASLGHMGGVIKLSGLSSDEKYDLEGFLKRFTCRRGCKDILCIYGKIS